MKKLLLLIILIIPFVASAQGVGSIWGKWKEIPKTGLFWKCYYPLNIAAGGAGCTYFRNTTPNFLGELKQQPNVTTWELSCLGIYVGQGSNDQYFYNESGHYKYGVLGFPWYVHTDYFSIGIRPIQFDITNGFFVLSFAPTIFYEHVWTGAADTSGNKIGWGSNDYDFQSYVCQNGVNYKNIGVGFYLTVNRLLSFGFRFTENSWGWNITFII